MGPLSPPHPIPDTIQEEKPSLDSASITNCQWRKWMDNTA